MDSTINSKPVVLLELRPALEGYAGIPQEVRLLFRELSAIEGLDVQGLIQTSHRTLSPGITEAEYFNGSCPTSKRFNRYSRTIVSLLNEPNIDTLSIGLRYVAKKLAVAQLLTRTLIGFGDCLGLTRFEAEQFEDFVWQTFFSKSLSPKDRSLVSSANFRICATPWHLMHLVGLASLRFRNEPVYPRLGMPGIDIFIAETPYPARINHGTTLVIRYHDAIPLFMPHTIGHRSLHQATHFHALASNVSSGAWFACVSDSTRQSLIEIFPQVADRTVTIHNMISPQFYLEDSPFSQVQTTIRSHLATIRHPTGLDMQPTFSSRKDKEDFFAEALDKGRFPYLLIVSTIEPRKNHQLLLAAWERLKNTTDPSIKLIVVGGMGWNNGSLLQLFKPWIDRGQVFILNAVPANQLRGLYRHASATICPSVGEGFDYSGIESMRCGGITIASDIPVHREVYGNAAEYFDPYDEADLLETLRRVLYAPTAKGIQERLRDTGQSVVSKYLPEEIVPKWNSFLKKLRATGSS